MRKTYARRREHGAPGWLLIYTLGGIGRFGHDGGVTMVTKGDLALIKPSTRNDYGLEDSQQRWDLLWAYFFPRPEWHKLLNWPEISKGFSCLHLADGKIHSQIIRLLREVHRYNIGPHRYRESFAMNALEKCLLYCDQINPLSEQSRMDRRVLDAMNYLCDNLDKTVTLTMVSHYCGISVSRLAHLFREHSGQSLHQFLEIQRVTRARQLLEMTHEPLANIAGELGFTDQFHFSRRFKHYIGTSPLNYRRKFFPAKSSIDPA